MPFGDQQTRSSERRAFPRFALGAMGEVAQLVNDEVPPRDVFEQVWCVDISRSGFSFFRNTSTEWESLVVALGDSPDFIYLTARIVSRRKVEHGGHVVYHIGCQFTGRLKLNEVNALKQTNDLHAAFIRVFPESL
ncbi:MAG: PilZ domain-containing protein [Pirellulaceae bacterium]